jgi:hypothetical protein
MRKDSLGLAKQVDLATEQTVMEYFPPVTDVTVTPQEQTMTIEETTGTEFPTGLEYGTNFYVVDAKGACRYSSLPRIISAHMGPPVTTSPDNVGAPTARKHAFDAANAPVPHSLLVSRVDPNPTIVDLIYGCLGNTLTLIVDPNGFMQFESSLIGMSNDQVQPAPTVTLDASKRVKFYDAKAYFTVNGGAENEFKCAGFNLAYNTNIDTDEAILGTQSLYTIQNQNKDAEVGFTVRDLLSAHYRRRLSSVPDSVKIRLTANGIIIGATTAFQVEVIIYACEYIDAPAAVSAQNRLKSIPVKARAKLDPVSGKFITVSVINTVTAY